MSLNLHLDLEVHLALEPNPGFELRVADEKRTWAHGKAFVFDDSFEHEVHRTYERRDADSLVTMWTQLQLVYR
jgi:hypothetical protein